MQPRSQLLVPKPAFLPLLVASLFQYCIVPIREDLHCLSRRVFRAPLISASRKLRLQALKNSRLPVAADPRTGLK